MIIGLGGRSNALIATSIITLLLTVILKINSSWTKRERGMKILANASEKRR